MGFRSTFTTQSCNIYWPDWFVKKYADSISMDEDNVGLLRPKTSCKTYGLWIDLDADIQKAIDWDKFCTNGIELNFILVYLHECGGITRVQIERNSIKYSEPSEWDNVDEISHYYHCGSNCSNAENNED